MRERRVKNALEAIANYDVPQTINLWPRIAARLEGRKTFMQTLRARPLVAILVAILALILLSGMAYAIGRLSGFIPGFGFTSDATPAYTLKETVSAKSGGIIVSVEKAVQDISQFWVEVSVGGLPAGEDYIQAFVLLPSGEKVQSQMGGTENSNAGETRLTYTFPALKGNPQHVTLLIENLGRQNFRLPLELRPIQPNELIPALPIESAPLYSEMHSGLTLVLDSIAADIDKTVFQVSLHFESAGMSLNSDWNVTLIDADGKIYPLTDVTPEILASSGVTKVYETVPFHGDEDLTLRLVTFPDSKNLPLSVDFTPEGAGFTFDPGVSPQVGKTWALDESVQVGSYQLHAVGARLVSPAELLFEFTPTDGVTGVMLYSPLASGASCGEPVTKGNFVAGMTFGKIPENPFRVYVTRVYYTASGEWQVHWQPPAAPAWSSGLSTSTPMPTPAQYAAPIYNSSDPTFLEVQSLAQKFDAPFQRGPGWVHAVSETITTPRPGQTFPPAYIQSEHWSEIDSDGYITRSVWIDRNADKQVIQQSATVGAFSVNLTTGDSGFNEFGRYRFSMDMLTPDLGQAAQYHTAVTRTETICEDGSTCLLITLLDSFGNPIQNPGETQSFHGSGRRIWINLQSGQQVKFESFWVLEDGQERIDFTKRVLLVEKVMSPPQEILDLLAKVVIP
jgi:hypothetical protein